jgi:hypothetical protein
MSGTLPRVDRTLTTRHNPERAGDQGHDTASARRAWEQVWGLKVGKPYPCPTRQLHRRACPGEDCCWWPPACSAPRALDHVYAVTRRSDGARGVLVMPYGLTDDSAAELTGWCKRHRCNWTALGNGWHYPGTVAVVIFPCSTSPPVGDSG